MVDDEEFFEFVEMEVCDFFSEYDFFGDDVLVVKGFVFKVFEGDVEYEEKIFEFMAVVDEYILILECDIEKLFMMLVEDVFLIIGCGIVVIGCVECG